MNIWHKSIYKLLEFRYRLDKYKIDIDRIKKLNIN